MTAILVKLLLVSLFYVLVFGYECGISYGQSRPRPMKEILNVNTNVEGYWPWIVAVFDNDVKICTGSIISPRFVLTAAHCYNQQMLNKQITSHSFSIRAGTINATKGEAVRVKKIRTFDEVVSLVMPRNDIAVFELERPLVFNDNVSSICLPKFFQEFPEEIAFLAGFGNVVHEDDNPYYVENNVLLNDVIVPFQDFEYCEKVSQYWNYTSLNYICAGSRMKGSYVGDSGGPIMIKDVVFQLGEFKRRWLAVGVVVGGDYLLSNPNDPLKWSHILYARVSYYCDWIENITDGEAQCIDVGMNQSLTTKSTFTTKNLVNNYVIERTLRQEIVSRAKCWTDKRVSYNQKKYALDCETGKSYRTDGSGYVSLSWQLSSNFTTSTLPTVCKKIDKLELKAGDAILAPGYHVTLFVKWADIAKTKYWAYEQTRQTGATYHIAKYSMGGHKFYPCRYNKISA